MSNECAFCNGSGVELVDGLGVDCVWCARITSPVSVEPEVTRYSESNMEGGGVAPARNGELCDYHHVARLQAEREALQLLLNERDEKLDEAKHRIERLRHVGMELTGVIDEYRAMPCDSLQVRMFQTADRYRKRLTAKCGNCEDHGVIGYTTGQTPETFDQGEYPCPECHPTEYAAWRKP